jgi:Holliday junction resolvasome RuvABC endonuclease subunit
MLKMIFNLAELPRPDHASDALAAAFCHANFSSFRSHFTDPGSSRV